MKCCINDVNCIRFLLLSTELFKFEIQKYGQILCVHKPYFLMPGHNYEPAYHIGGKLNYNNFNVNNFDLLVSPGFLTW